MNYWLIQCPHCALITYYLAKGEGKWPFLKCRCGKYYLFREAELARHCHCEKIEAPTDLQKRQAETIYLEPKK